MAKLGNYGRDWHAVAYLGQNEFNDFMELVELFDFVESVNTWHGRGSSLELDVVLTSGVKMRFPCRELEIADKKLYYATNYSDVHVIRVPFSYDQTNTFGKGSRDHATLHKIFNEIVSLIADPTDESLEREDNITLA